MLCPHRLEQSPSSLRTADSFTSFRSQLKTYVCETFVAGPLSAPLIPLPGLPRVINSRYSLTCVFCADLLRRSRFEVGLKSSSLER